MRRWLVLVLSLVALVVSASHASAQEDQGGEIVPETLPPDPSATSAPPPIVTEPPATTLPPGCSTPPPPRGTFVGELLAVGPLVQDSPDLLAQFRVVELADGDLSGFEGADGRINVDFGRDWRYLKIGDQYLVAADIDPGTGRLVSKARVRPALFGDNQVVGVNDGVTCPKFDDPVVTKLADGTAIDVGVLSPILSNKSEIGMRLARPALVAVAGLVGLVVLKRLLIGTGRLAKWLGRRTRSRDRAAVKPPDAPEARPAPLPTREPSAR